MTNENHEWVILEAMGHTRTAGRYVVENGLHRVDVPDTSPGADPDRFIRTERYGAGSIFRITSVTEEVARMVARRAAAVPDAIPWDARSELRQLAAPAQETLENFVDDNEELGDF